MAETYNVIPGNSPVTNVALNADDVMNIYSGGTATATTINDGGYLYVNSGGVADHTNAGAWMDILEGGVASNTTLLENCWVTVYSGGIASTVLVSSGGLMEVSSGGIVKDATVNAYGELYISGKVTGQITFADGAVVSSYEGGIIDFDISELSPGNAALLNKLSILKGARDYTLTVDGSQATGKYTLAGGVPSFNKSITVVDTLGTELGTLTVGTAEDIGGMSYTLALNGSELTVTVAGGGTDKIITGDITGETKDVPAEWTALNVNINADGKLNVLDGGLATGTTVNTDGELNVSSGGLATGTTVNDYGYLYVDSNGMASTTTVSNGYLLVDFGGMASNTTLVNDGYLYVSSGGTASKATIDNGRIFVLDGGSANDITVNNGALVIRSGGTATGIVWTPCEGIVTIDPGGYATFVNEYSGVYYGSDWHLLENATMMDGKTVNDGNTMFVMDGGTANNTTVNKHGFIYVWSGGAASNTTLNTSGFLYVSGGEADKTTVNSDGYLYVKDGGVANNTTATDHGVVVVSNGGLAVNATLVNYSYLIVSSGGTASNTTVSKGDVYVMDGGVASSTLFDNGYFYVSSGGVVSKTTVLANGNFIVSSGAVANDITNSGYLSVNSGGSATNIIWTPCEGVVYVADGGYATFATKYSGVYYGEDGKLLENAAAMDGKKVDDTHTMYVMDGGVATNTASEHGYLYVWSGGVADNTTVKQYGHLDVSSGGAASNTTVNKYGYLRVYSGGKASNTTVNDGTAYVEDGGVANDTTVNEGGYLIVSSGGVVSKSTVNTNSYLDVSSGGVASNTTVNSKGRMYISEGGAASNTTVNNSGYLYVSTGGAASDTTVNSGGYLLVSEGGAASDTTVNSGGYLLVFEGGAASDTTVNSGGCLYVYSGGVVSNTTTDYAADIESGGVASDITIMENGWVTVSSGASADNITVLSAAYLRVESGGTATNIVWTPGLGGSVEFRPGGYVTFATKYSGVYLGSGGTLLSNTTVMDGKTVDKDSEMWVMDNGVATNTTADHGSVFVWSGGMASNTTLVNYGRLYVSNGGVASNTTLNTNSYLDVSSGGVASNTTVNANGWLYVSSGGRITGQMNFADGAHVTAYEGSIIDFDISAISPANAALVNNLALVTGTPTYTLTVSNTQEEGTYNLAGGATDFDKTITVVNTFDTELGTLTVAGGETDIGGRKYTLALNGSELTVTITGAITIDTTLPTVSNIVASTTAPTNKSVTVTADFTDNVGIATKLYKIGDGSWTNYVDGVDMTENGTVYFKAVDMSGNESSGTDSITVSNIDKVAPTITGITASTTAPATSVTVTAVFDDDVELSTTLYRIGDGGWFNYNMEGVTVTTNTTVYFKATDTAGNATTASYDVTNIETTTPDTTKPTVTNIAASTTALTNNNVFVTADFLDNVAVKSKLYKLGSGAWTAYVDDVVVTENATVYFKAVDTSDNESDVEEYAVTNIDKVAPTITNITHSPTAPAKSVTVTATFADNIGLATKQYKIGTSGAWTDYVDGVIMTENGTVYFWAVDTAGNESSTVSHTVTNIEPTGSSITGDITGETKDVPAGWTALNVNVNTGGKLNVLDGGVASNTNVNAGGRLYVSSGGIARDTTVNDGGLIEGSGCEIDGIVVNSGGSLLLYSGAKLTGQMTFASGAEVIPFVGSILDFDLTQTEPGSPALVNDLSILMGTPTYTITVDNSQALGTYKLAGGAAGFDKPITVRSIYGEIGCTLTVDGGATKLGDVYLTLALSGSDLTFTISEDSGGGIIPDNKPDDGKNDYLYKKKADPEWNNANIHVTNEITGNGEVRLDLPGTIDTEDGKHNLFGHDKDNMDTGDVAQVEVNDPAKLTFTIDSNAAGTFFVYEDGFDKKGNRKMITVKKVTVKAGKLATLKDVCLTSTGKYYVAMTAKNVKKVGTEGLYNVNVIESKFFVDADEGANKNNTADEGKTISVGRDQDKNIVLDGNPMKGSTEFNSFVGFTDGKDYAKLDLTDSAYLKFHVTGDGDGKAKFTIWKQTKGTTGKLSKVTSVSLPAKKMYDATTKAQFLDTSKYTFYVSMECSDEAKGKGVYYNVQITDDAVFFDSNDDGKNNVLYDKKAKSFYVEDANHHFESTTIGTETKVKLDTNPVADTDWENFVGYQDAADYAKIELASDGKLSLHIEATGNATFTVYRKGQDKKGNDTLETIQTAKLAVASGASKTEKDIQISDLEAGEYYVSMAAKSTKANSTGSVFYNVTATLDAVVTSALEMPMAAAAYADSVQDKLSGESGSGLLASL